MTGVELFVEPAYMDTAKPQYLDHLSITSPYFRIGSHCFPDKETTSKFIYSNTSLSVHLDFMTISEWQPFHFRQRFQ